MSAQTSDSELLGLAAKAIGEKIVVEVDGWMMLRGQEEGWNPLISDGDALRLVSSLWLSVDWYSDQVEVIGGQGNALETFNRADSFGKSAALRRAIVRAAAEIGRKMP